MQQYIKQKNQNAIIYDEIKRRNSHYYAIFKGNALFTSIRAALFF